MKRFSRPIQRQAQQHHRFVDLLGGAEQADLDLLGLGGAAQRLDAVDRLGVGGECLVEPALALEDIAAAVVDEVGRVLVAQLLRQLDRVLVLRQRRVPARLGLVEKAELEVDVEREFWLSVLLGLCYCKGV